MCSSPHPTNYTSSRLLVFAHTHFCTCICKCLNGSWCCIQWVCDFVTTASNHSYYHYLFCSSWPRCARCLTGNQTDVRARQLPVPNFRLLRKQRALRQRQDWQCEDFSSEYKNMYRKLNAILTEHPWSTAHFTWLVTTANTCSAPKGTGGSGSLR